MRFKSLFKNQTFFLFIIILLLSVAAGLVNPRFFTIQNFLSILRQSTVLGILSMSMALLLISGSIDLSIGAMMGLGAVISCTMVMNGFSVFLAVLAGFFTPVVGSLFNGLIVSWNKSVPPLIITLGMSFVYSGLSLVVSGGQFLSMQGKFYFLGGGEIGGIPVPVIVLVVVVSAVHVLLKYTKYGRRVVAMGGNEELAFLSGIETRRYEISNFLISGGLVGLASLVLVSRLGSVVAGVGSGYALRALAAAIIGGVTFEGGRGTVFGTLLGVILLGVISNGMNILNISSYYQDVVSGLIIVIAVIVSSIGAWSK
ncbi:MAG: ABC transporter permease [Candidatus Bipolaricaulota bacterium]|nr:ABC transporter permease [Candidatus Bipolaricaulota bacterium]